MILQVVLDGARDGRAGPAGRLQTRLYLPSPGLVGISCRPFCCLLHARFGLRVELVALGDGAVPGDVLAASEGGLADFLRLFLVHG
jgi:hypothetical protein